MSYLDNTSYLGEEFQAPMRLPTELADQLVNNSVQHPENWPVPPDYVRLPGGVIIAKKTLWVLGIALAAAIVYWVYYKKKKKK
jgi:hypothetical protein